MLPLNSTSIRQRSFLSRTKSAAGGLVLGGALLLASHAAPAAPVINSFSYISRAVMTNSGIEPTARGTVLGNLTRRGAVDNQRLTLTVSKLQADTTYHVVVFLDDSVTGTVVPDFDFTTTQGGSSSIPYLKSRHPGRHPLPAAVDPISNLRELDIVNGNGDTVLQADLTRGRSRFWLVLRSPAPGLPRSMVILG